MRRWLPALLVVCVCTLSAQSTVSPGAQPDAQEFVGEPLVVDRSAITVTVESDGAQTLEQEGRATVLSQAGVESVGTLAFPYRRQLGSLDFVYVRVRKPNGEVVETPVSSAIDLPADTTRLAPQFSDVFVKNINVVGLAIGDVLEYKVHQHEASLVPGQYWFEYASDQTVITRDTEVRLTIPASMTPLLRSRGGDPSVTVEGDRRVYLWHRQTLKHLTAEERALRDYANRDARAEIQVTTFRSWEDVGKAVQTLWKDRAAVTPAIRTKAAELTSGAATEADKARALYTFVATKIRYVAVSLGIGAIQPHTADEVLSSGFGDCKDKHTLLTALLHAAGITADAVLIGVDQPLDREVPSIIPFNHVITAVHLNGSTSWLDATLEVAPFGFIPFGERDKNVLIVPATGDSTLVKTPASISPENLWRTRAEGSVDAAGKLDLHVTETISGDVEILIRRAFRSLSPTQWPELVKQFSITALFGGTPSQVTTSPVEDTSAAFQVSYHYVNESLRAWPSSFLYAPLPSMPLPAIADSAPAVPVVIGPSMTFNATARVSLPATIAAKLGAGTEPVATVSMPGFSVKMTSSLDGHVYQVDRTLTMDRREIAVADFPAYRTFAKSASELPDFLSFRALRPWAFGDDVDLDWYEGAAAPAVRILKEAAVSASAGEYPKALASAQSLTREEPRTAAAWLMLGWIQIDSGNRDAGLQTLRRQAELTPQPALLKELAIQLGRANLRDEAAAVSARGRTLYPDDRDFAHLLSEHLIALGRFAEARDVLVQEVQRDPLSPRAQWNLGKALVGLKQIDRAIVAFKQAVDADGSAYCLNEVAWALVDAGAPGDDAMRWATQSVSQSELAISKLTLAALADNDLAIIRTLTHAWDTLAWAYFRKGDLDAANGYAQASWWLSPRQAAADHWVAIAGARKDRAGADATAAAVADPATQKADLPRLPGAEGTAELFVMVGADGSPTDVRFISGAAALRPEAEMARTAKFAWHAPTTGLSVPRRGTLRCPVDAQTCQFSLLPAITVTSVK